MKTKKASKKQIKGKTLKPPKSLQKIQPLDGVTFNFGGMKYTNNPQ